MGKATDLKGMVFGRLTVLRRSERTGTTFWECRCECGNVKIARAYMLVSGRTRSCGCLNLELVRTRGVTHGKSKTVEYKIYCLAKNRCTENNKRYHRYCGRGIEFRFTSFEQFFSELGQRPEGCSLDRIDNDGHYEPGNVRWANASEQANNKCNCVYATVDGVTKTIGQWFGSRSNRALRCYKRVYKGWSPSDAVIYEMQNEIFEAVEQ